MIVSTKIATSARDYFTAARHAVAQARHDDRASVGFPVDQLKAATMARPSLLADAERFAAAGGTYAGVGGLATKSIDALLHDPTLRGVRALHELSGADRERALGAVVEHARNATYGGY